MSAAIAIAILAAVSAPAQDRPRLYAGGLVGVSTLSADGRADLGPTTAALSLYKPENGAALNLFAGVDVAQYFSVQGNWIWNRNQITLVSSLGSDQQHGFYEQRRGSDQHAAVIDGLIYFRRPDSAIRPYLGTGLALVRFSSASGVAVTEHGLLAPRGAIESTRLGLRSHVGIDIRLSRSLGFRYSFSETISGNPISAALMPPAPRGLANFQNLFGFVTRF
jgi:hypothetical protein